VSLRGPWGSSRTTPPVWWPWPGSWSRARQAGEALELLAVVPETADSRVVAAEARLAAQQVEVPADGVDVLLDSLLPR